MTPMRTSVAAVVLLALTTAASAQPGADPQAPPQPGYPPQQPQYPQPYGQQQPYYPPNPGYGPPIQLTIEDQELLASGEISDGQHLGGAALAVFMGFGIGQAVQGRWSDRGYIFTLGEIAAIAALIYGAAEMINNCDANLDTVCNSRGNDTGVAPFVVGLIGFSVLRIWEVVDSITGPIDHNTRLRNLRIRTGYRPMGYGGIKPFVAPSGDQGATAGITFRF